MMKSRAIGAGVAVAAASALAFVLVHVATKPEISVVATFAARLFGHRFPRRALPERFAHL